LKRWKLSTAAVAGATALGLVALAAPNASAVTAHSVNWAHVTHLAKTGPTDMANLVKAAEKEGSLNVITLPDNWANYGTIIKDFSKRYHIAINSENPEGSSQDELNAINADVGRSDDPDVVDVGQSFAIEGLNDCPAASQSDCWAPYEVQTWKNIPGSQKNANGQWYGDYGGYVSIGCNTKTVAVCPTSFKQMLQTGKGYKIGINNNPTEASAAFSAVFAAALSNGGSFNNVKPGVDWFSKLNKEGNFVATIAGPSTVESGATNIVIWWDYLQASEISAPVSQGGAGFGKSWKVVIPTDASYAAYYDQAINSQAPHPAAARLWQEYLYSVTGQNLWLQGEARPIELPYLVAHHLANKTWLAALPPAPKGATHFPTQGQLTNAKAVVAADWPTEVTTGP
jgi:putative spermidine/putrescine transport system substrate-binding protein